jgi:hypothetical protein
VINPCQMKVEVAVEYLGQRTVPRRMTLNGTIIGGLSAISYDPHRSLYYVVSDDRSVHNPARFYTVRLVLSVNGVHDIEFVDVQPLLDVSGAAFDRNDLQRQPAVLAPDPEGIAFDAVRQRLYWSSEGFAPLHGEAAPIPALDPWIRISGLDGRYLGEFCLPANLKLSSGNDLGHGARPNGSIEGLTLSPDGRFLYAAMEDPLYEDGDLPDSSGGALIRITKFDVETLTAVAQYAYRVEATMPLTETNGVSDIVALSDGSLIVMERSGSLRLKLHVRLFRARVGDATDILEVPSLAGVSVATMRKTLIADLPTIPVLALLDNVEGITLGPTLSDGRQSVVLISDDNFSERQVTQFLAFAM